MNNLISVIIPVYKVERYIEKCLDSVIYQTYKNLEIIIIDDGSPDNCAEIIDEYARIDKRIRVIHKQNEGLSAARNDGIRISTGDWLFFVDSDDWIEYDACEKLMRALANKDADVIVFNGFRTFVSHETVINSFKNDFYTDDKDVISSLQKAALCYKFAPFGTPSVQGYPWNKIFNANMVKKNHIFFSTNVRANEDVIFNINIFQYAKRVLYTTSPLYHYRDNPMGITVKYTPNRISIDLEIYREILTLAEVYNLDKKFYDALNARIVMNTWHLTERVFFNCENPNPFRKRMKELVETLRISIIYDAFDMVDRKKLSLSCKVITIRRHENAYLIWIVYQMKKWVESVRKYIR